jgi:hypothetical protein
MGSVRSMYFALAGFMQYFRFLPALAFVPGLHRSQDDPAVGRLAGAGRRSGRRLVARALHPRRSRPRAHRGLALGHRRDLGPTPSRSPSPSPGGNKPPFGVSSGGALRPRWGREERPLQSST